MLFSSPWTEQWRIAINSVVLASQYRERVFLLGGSHKTKWDLMISHQKFPGHQDKEAGREVQGAEQLSPLKMFRCHLAARWNNRDWKWTARRQAAEERWSEMWVTYSISIFKARLSDYCLDFRRVPIILHTVILLTDILTHFGTRDFQLFLPDIWHVAPPVRELTLCWAFLWCQNSLFAHCEEPSARQSSLTDVWERRCAIYLSARRKHQGNSLVLLCLRAFFPLLLDRICNAASLSQKMTHNDFCYHLRMFRQNK